MDSQCIASRFCDPTIKHIFSLPFDNRQARECGSTTTSSSRNFSKCRCFFNISYKIRLKLFSSARVSERLWKISVGDTSNTMEYICMCVCILYCEKAGDSSNNKHQQRYNVPPREQQICVRGRFFWCSSLFLCEFTSLFISFVVSSLFIKKKERKNGGRTVYQINLQNRIENRPIDNHKQHSKQRLWEKIE